MEYQKLGEIVTIKYGKDHKGLSNGNIPVYGTGGLMRKVDKYLYDKPSVLIPRKGSLNNVMFVSEKFWTVDTMFWTIVNTKIINPKYLYYYLSRLNLNKLNVGSAVPSLTVKILNEIVIPVPKLTIQDNIVKKISVFDRKINLNNQINDNLFELAMTEFKRRFSTSGLGKISDYFLPKRGKNLLKKDVIAGNIPVVAGGLHPAAYHNQSNTQFPVITISASGANAGYVQLWGENVWSSDSSYIDKSVTSNAFFWYLVLKSKQKQIFDAQTGSAQPHIYPKHIGNLQVPKYSDEEISKFNSFISPLFNQVFQNNRENRKLSILRDLLLNKYF